MKKIGVITIAVFLLAGIFAGCEKEVIKEVIVHDTVFVDYPVFTFKSSGTDELGDMVIFSDPNYPTGERLEIFQYNWEYFNDLKTDEWFFFGASTGNALSLFIDGVELAESVSIVDDWGEEWEYLEYNYNTSKKSEINPFELIEKYRKK